MENKNILITGGAGFIGSNAILAMVRKYPSYQFYNLDALTYAGNLENLTSIENAPNYSFLKGNILNEELVSEIFKSKHIDHVLHFAAESHVDRSISHPGDFVKTNVLGTVTLLNVARNSWKDTPANRTLFYHISTDEVYGSLGEEGLFTEHSPYDPRSPYSASKASSDHFVRAYHETYGLPTVISNCSNNYGPFQFPEKLVPLMINNIILRKNLPVYGDGTNVRDWLYVGDHVSAIDTILHRGKVGETYNIGGNNEMKNIELVHMLCDILDEKLGYPVGSSRNLITFVKDRPGHDQRYAIDSSKIQIELGWAPIESVKSGMIKTVDWYLNHSTWLDGVTSGDYKSYYRKQYGKQHS